MFQLIMGVAIAILIVIYLRLRKSQHSEANLPAVSEDVNLPTEFLDPLKQGQETTPRTNVPDKQPPQQ